MKMKEAAPVLDIKALDDSGRFSGYASVFGSVDLQGEATQAGAFIGSLVDHRKRGSKVRMFWQHQSSEPIGRWLDISEDGKGLFVDGQLNLDVNRGREVHSFLKNGDIDGLSIGYREVRAETEGNVRKLLELDLREVSVVSLPALPRARVDSVKSEECWDRLEEFFTDLRAGKPRPIKEFEDILREAGAPKSMATTIASVGYAKAIRSDSEGDEADMAALHSAVRSFITP